MLQENMQNKEVRVHPTQKPVALYSWLLSKYAKPNDLILDTHGGSMSSVIACIKANHSIVCSELDKDYFEQATQRVKDFASQQDIFQTNIELNIAS